MFKVSLGQAKRESVRGELTRPGAATQSAQDRLGGREAAARAVIAGRSLATPKTGIGAAEELARNGDTRRAFLGGYRSGWWR